MSLRRVDIRFALPHPIERAAVLGGLIDWEEGLRQGGVAVVDDPREAQLVVAPHSLAAVAGASGAPMLVLEGGRGAPDGYAARRVVQVPDDRTPTLLLPLGDANAVRYAIRRRRPGATRLTRVRNGLAREALARGVELPGRPATTVAARDPGPPHAVALAAEAVGIERPEWFASIGEFAHAYSRAVFYVFAPDEPMPGWVVKFTRIPGLADLFDLDEQGLRLAEAAGGVVAAAAPRLVGRFELGGDLHASAETSAIGVLLGAALRAQTPRAERLELIERLAEWIVAVARQTISPAPALDEKLQSISTDVMPHWVEAGLPARLVAALPPLPSVLVHGDLYGENVFVDGDRFTIVDWESAVAHGPPLWDILYFLADSLATLDGAESADARLDHFVRLFRGELESSEVLFRWTRNAAAAASLLDSTVGPLATLLWLELALLEERHVARVDPLQPREASLARPPMRHRSERWLADAGLGTAWPSRRG